MHTNKKQIMGDGPHNKKNKEKENKETVCYPFKP